MLKKSLFLTFLFYIVCSTGYSNTGRTYTDGGSKENDAYLQIALGFLDIGDRENAYLYAGKLTTQRSREGFYFSEFKILLRNDELDKAIESIKNLTIIDTIKKRKTSWTSSNNNRENAIKMIVDHYWKNGEEKLAFDFAKKHNNEAAYSKLCSNTSRKYLDEKNYDSALRYAEMITFELDKNNMISQISIDLMYDYNWDRGLELCQKISTVERREETYFTISSRLIKAGFLDRLPEFINLFSNEYYHDELRVIAVRTYMEKHFYSCALDLTEQVKSEYHKERALDAILNGYLKNGDLGKAITFISDNQKIINGSEALQEYAKACCIAGKFNEAIKMADRIEFSSKRDAVYSVIVEYSLRIDNIERVNYIVDELLGKHPMSAYRHICKYYCSKNNLQKAASYADMLKDEDRKDEIFQIITSHCMKEKLYDQAIEYANFMDNTYKKQRVINSVERELKYLKQEK
jgi:hypothetical protein